MAVTSKKNTLVEIWPWLPSAAATELLTFSTRGFKTAPTDSTPNQAYPDRLIGGLTLQTSAYTSGAIGGPSLPDRGTLQLNNADGWLDIADDGRQALADYTWDGRRCRVLELEVGQSYADAVVVFDGTLADLAPGSGVYVLQLRGEAHQFTQPLQAALYTPVAVALEFDGVADSVVLPSECNPLELDEWSIELWSRVARGGISTGTVVWMNDLTNGWQVVKIGSTNADGGVSIGSQHLSNGQLADGQLHHVAISSRNGVQTVYVDAEEWGEVSGFSVAAGGDAGGMRLGSASGSQYWAGAMGDVRVWSTALAQADIEQRYRSRLDGTESGLHCWYPLNEGVDLSFNASVVAGAKLDGTEARSDAWVFDNAATVAGSGQASIGGSPEWVQTGERLNAEPGVRKPLPLGRVRNWEPDTSDPRANFYTISSDPVFGVPDVSVGGRSLGDDAKLTFDGTTGRIAVPDSSSLDWADGEGRTFSFEIEPEDNDATQVLLETSTGSASWRIELVEDAKSRLQPSVTITNSSGTSTTLLADVAVRPTVSADSLDRKGLQQIDVSVELGGPMAIYVNGALRGTATAPAGPSNSGALTVFNSSAFTDGFAGIAHRFAIYDGFLRPKPSAAALVTREQRRQKLLDELGTPLVELNLDDGSGTTATDSGSIGGNGTTTGGTWAQEDCEITNGPGGCFLQLGAAPNRPVRVDVEGWLPRGHALTGGSLSGQRAFRAHESALNYSGAACFWVTIDHKITGTLCLLLRKWTSGSTVGSWQYRVETDGRIRFLWVDDTGSTITLTSATPAADLGWTACFVRIEADGTSTLYLNGEEVDTASGTVVSANADASELRFASALDGMKAHHAGLLEGDIASGEVTYVHDPEVVLQHSPLAHWSANENAGSTVHDLSPNGLHLAVTGAEMAWTTGEYPETAAALAPFLAARAGLGVDRQDAASFAEFDALAAAAPVGLLVRDQTVGNVLDEIVRPVGLWGVNASTRAMYLSTFRAPDVDVVPSLQHPGGIASQYLSVAGDTSVDRPKTLECWVRWREFGAGGGDQDVFRSANFSLQILTTGHLAAYFIDPSGAQRTVVTVPAVDVVTGEWIHLAATADGRLIMDGVEFGKTTVIDSSASFTSSGSFSVGWLLQGEVHGARMWSTARTTEQISEWRHLDVPTNEAGFVDAWRMNESSGLTAASATGTRSGTWNAEPSRSVVTVPSYRLPAVELVRSERTFNQEDGQVITVTPQPVELPSALERVAYGINEDPHDRADLLGIVLEQGALVEELAQPYSVETAATPQVEVDHLLPAVHQVRMSRLATQAGARRAVDISAANHGRKRLAYRVEVWGRFDLEPGDEVRLQLNRGSETPRLGLPKNGRNFLVLGVERNGDHRTTLRLWG